MKQKIVECFNKGAKTYDLAAPIQTKVAKQLASRIAGWNVQTILEIGCGTGLFSQMLYSTFSKASLLLTDISPNMLEHCRQRFDAVSRVQFACVDGETLLMQNSFDLIVSNMTLHWFEDIQQSLSTIIKKLNPRGYFAFTMLGANSFPEWQMICDELQISMSMPLLPNIDELCDYFPHMQFDTAIEQRIYPSMYDFLKSLKKIGAHATDIPVLSSGKMRSFLRQYNHEIKISYEIIYGHYQHL